MALWGGGHEACAACPARWRHRVAAGQDRPRGAMRQAPLAALRAQHRPASAYGLGLSNSRRNTSSFPRSSLRSRRWLAGVSLLLQPWRGHCCWGSVWACQAGTESSRGREKGNRTLQPLRCHWGVWIWLTRPRACARASQRKARARAHMVPSCAEPGRFTISVNGVKMNVTATSRALALPWAA